MKKINLRFQKLLIKKMKNSKSHRLCIYSRLLYIFLAILLPTYLLYYSK